MNSSANSARFASSANVNRIAGPSRFRTIGYWTSTVLLGTLKELKV